LSERIFHQVSMLLYSISLLLSVSSRILYTIEPCIPTPSMMTMPWMTFAQEERFLQDLPNLEEEEEVDKKYVKLYISADFSFYFSSLHVCMVACDVKKKTRVKSRLSLPPPYQYHTTSSLVFTFTVSFNWVLGVLPIWEIKLQRVGQHSRTLSTIIAITHLWGFGADFFIGDYKLLTHSSHTLC